MPSAVYDLGFLRAGLGTLDSYLMSPDIYWTLGERSPAGEPAYPQLTLGSLLLAQRRLHARELSSESDHELLRMDRELESSQARWRVAWEKKAAREFSARLKLWRDYLDDYRSNPEDNADRFDYEVNRRVMLELLKPYAVDASSAEYELLEVLDTVLKSAIIPGEFLWEKEMSAGFPDSNFWFLYGALRGKQS